MNVTTMREVQVNIRLSPEEDARFKRVAARYGTTIPETIRLLMKRADEELGDQRRKEWLDTEAAWEADKRLIAWLVELVNRFKLEAVPDEKTRLFWFESPIVAPVGRHGPYTREEAIRVLASWPDGDVLMIDPHTRVVTSSPSRAGRIEITEPPEEALDPTALEALRRWRERQLREARGLSDAEKFAAKLTGKSPRPKK